MGSIRLFAGITPPAAARDHLDSALEDVRARARDSLRWTPRPNWHITISFYGAQPAGSLDEISEFLASVADARAPLNLRLAGAGSFQSNRLWIGVGGETERLRALMSESMLDADLPHRHRAHLSVATMAGASRYRGGKKARGQPHAVGPGAPRIEHFVRALSVYSGPEFAVDELELFHSRLGEGPGGAPAYDVLARFPLGAST